MEDFFPAPSWRLKAGGKKAFWRAGESVTYFLLDLSGIIAGISPSSLSGEQEHLSHSFLITNFHFLCLRGDGIN